ncbi:hypothetical protein [Gordonia sp. CPCC 205333]|uniref:hypothetical protein n=1 Tax=Gordonia sp. CPCC 205333 TaxID=3140790 RepID=UPI003AF33A8C
MITMTIKPILQRALLIGGATALTLSGPLASNALAAPNSAFNIPGYSTYEHRFSIYETRWINENFPDDSFFQPYIKSSDELGPLIPIIRDQAKSAVTSHSCLAIGIGFNEQGKRITYATAYNSPRFCRQ